LVPILWEEKPTSSVKLPVELVENEPRDKVWAASDTYNLRGITSGVVKKRCVSKKVSVGVYDVAWPEWMTIDLSFIFIIAWICIKQDTVSVLLGALHPGTPIYLEAEVSDLPQVAFVFCSHATLPKRFALWTSRELKLVFTSALVRQRSRRWREWTDHSLCMDHAKLGGTSDRVSWILVFGHGLNLSGLTAPARAPREVSSVCYDHHFGIDAPPQLSRRHKNLVVVCVSPGVFHGDGVYPMTTGSSSSPYFLLRSKYAVLGWCKRRLRVGELLQVYDVNDVICKRMMLQQRSQLVATPQLTPFKILVAATSLVLNDLPGGGGES
jgi:hypothetical protein